MSKTPKCLHRRAIIVRGGTLYPEQRRAPYEAAWCPSCGAFREDAVGKDSEPWKLPSR